MSKWIAPTIIGVVGVLILSGLGIWQIQRLEWKEALIAELDAKLKAEPQNIEDVDMEKLEELNGTPVIMRGEFGEGHTDLLSGNAEGAGYRRFVPFHTENLSLLAELGFLLEAQRDAVFVLPKGEVEVKGHLDVPKNTDGSFDERLNIWVGNNPKGMAEALGTAPILVALSQSPIKELEDTPMTIDLPNNHLQYAITWFSLAFVWGIMAIYWGIRRTKEE